MSDITWAGYALSWLVDAIIEAPPETNRPARKIDRYKVPGRNGDVIVPQDAWENVSREYDIVITGASYDAAAEVLARWLYGPSGYQELSDTFDSAVYRKAYVSEKTRIKNLMNTNGRCTIAFECDPRRFLKIGKTAVTLSATTNVSNPTGFKARPAFTVHGSGAGSIEAGGCEIAISDIEDGMVIDCENMRAYKNDTNLNGIISGDFPVIQPGTRTITLDGGITSVDMTPNWWTL